MTKNNDTTFVIYVCSIIRAIVSLHNLIDNRIMNKEAKEKNKEEAEAGKLKAEEEKAKKAKEEKVDEKK